MFLFGVAIMAIRINTMTTTMIIIIAFVNYRFINSGVRVVEHHNLVRHSVVVVGTGKIGTRIATGKARRTGRPRISVVFIVVVSFSFSCRITDG